MTYNSSLHRNPLTTLAWQQRSRDRAKANAKPRQPLKQKSARQRAKDREFDKACPMPEGQLCQWPDCLELARHRHHVKGRGRFLTDLVWIRFLCARHHRFCTGTWRQREQAVAAGMVGSRFGA